MGGGVKDIAAASGAFLAGQPPQKLHARAAIAVIATQLLLCALLAAAPPPPCPAQRQFRAPAPPPPLPHLNYWAEGGVPLKPPPPPGAPPAPSPPPFRLPPLTPENTAYSMMACGGYAYHFSALIAARSIRRFDPRRDIVVHTTPHDLPPSDIAAAMAALNASYHVVSAHDFKEMEARLHVRCGHFHNCWLKLFVWGMVRYAAVLNVDTDYVALYSPEYAFELFARGARTPYDVGGVADLTVAFSHPDSSTADVFNGGWFVAQPSADTFEKIVAHAVGPSRWKWGEMLTLNTFPGAHGGQWVRMPAGFNVVPAMLNPRAPFFIYDKPNVQSLFGLHFAGSSKVKPGTTWGDCAAFDGRGDSTWSCERWVLAEADAKAFLDAVVMAGGTAGVNHHGLSGLAPNSTR